jgi:hypothetical protein
MLESNPGQLRLRHRLSDALTTRLDLISILLVKLFFLAFAEPRRGGGLSTLSTVQIFEESHIPWFEAVYGTVCSVV